jgi:hypothetical protein
VVSSWQKSKKSLAEAAESAEKTGALKRQLDNKMAKATHFGRLAKSPCFLEGAQRTRNLGVVAHLRAGDISVLHFVLYVAPRRCAQPKCASSSVLISLFSDVVCVTAPKMRSLLRAFSAHLRENTAIFNFSGSCKRGSEAGTEIGLWISNTDVWEGEERVVSSR